MDFVVHSTHLTRVKILIFRWWFSHQIALLVMNGWFHFLDIKSVIFVTDGIGNLMSGLLGNIFDVDYDDDTLTTSEPLRTPSIQVRIPGVSKNAS